MDIETRRKKQKALMRRMVERKVRSRAQQLYESRGQTDGHALQDWFQAESEVSEVSSVARLARRLRAQGDQAEEDPSEGQCEESTCTAQA